MNDMSVSIIIAVQGIVICVLPLIGWILYAYPLLVVFPLPVSLVIVVFSFYSASKIYRDDKTDLLLHVYTGFCAYLGIANFASPFVLPMEMFYLEPPIAPIYIIINILLYLQYPMNLAVISGGYFLVIPPLIMEIHLRGANEPNISHKQGPEIA